jgi:hypothetical protein
MRSLLAVLVAGCYTGPAPAPAQAPPPQAPPVRAAKIEHRGPIACPPESELQRNDSVERCVRRGSQQSHGPAIVRDEQGRVTSETSWRDGQKDGVQRIAYPGGVLALEEHWHAGHRTGTWRYFYRSGVRSHERDFADDREIAHRAYDEHGDPRPLPALTRPGCTVDADCTIGPGSLTDGCCAAQPDCGGPMSRLALAQINDRCAGVYCGEPQPSSSCMGTLGTHPACQQGICVRIR